MSNLNFFKDILKCLGPHFLADLSINLIKGGSRYVKVVFHRLKQDGSLWKYRKRTNVFLVSLDLIIGCLVFFLPAVMTVDACFFIQFKEIAFIELVNQSGLAAFASFFAIAKNFSIILSLLLKNFIRINHMWVRLFKKSSEKALKVFEAVCGAQLAFVML